MKLLASFVVLLFFPLILFGEIIHVPDQYESIQMAIDSSEHGDTVLVEPGEYVGSINFVGKRITVASLFLTTGDESHIAETVLDGNDEERVVSIRNEENDDAVLCGFTIQNGSSGYGGGIYCRGTTPILKNLIIRNNYASNRGGGLYSTTGANPRVDHVTFTENIADDGGGAFRTFNESNISMVNSIVWGNEPNELQDELNFTYSDIQGGYNGEGNINSDPQFVDPDEGNFQLSDDSPCIDVGNPDDPENPDGTRCDMGALSYSHRPMVRISPDELRFDQRVGVQSQQTVTVENFGVLTAHVISVVIEENAPFSVEAIGEPIALEDAEEYDIVVTYAPEETGEHEAVLQIETDDPDRELVEIALFGSATPPTPEIEVSEHRINYGEVVVRRSTSREFTVTNIGDAALSVGSISIDGEMAEQFRVSIDQFELQPNENQVITVTVAPALVGEFEANLLIESNDPINGEINVSLGGTSILPESHYNFTSNTGVNHTLFLREATFGGEPLEIGNEIGVYSPDNRCCGGVMWMGEEVGFVAWGDNEITEEIDGLREDEEMSFRIWDFVTEQEHIATPEFFQDERFNGDEVYHDDGLSVFTLSVDFEEVVGFMLHMRAGWNMVSAPIVPDDNSIVNLWSPVVERENLVILKDYRGRFYVPTHGFNGIPFWNHLAGYQARLAEPDSLFIEGEWIAEDTPIELQSGWSMVAYFPEVEVDARVAFENIEDILVIAKDGAGHFYVPALGFSNMGSLRRGEGYQVNMSDAGELVWNVPQERVDQLPIATNPTLPSTGLNMSLMIDGLSNVPEGTELTVHTVDGLMVGKVDLHGDGPWGLAIWGDDPTSDQIDGAVENETLSFRLWSGDREVEANVNWIVGDVSYKTDELSVIEIQSTGEPVIATDFRLDDAYPNPFNSTTKLRFSLREDSKVTLSIFGVDGREVTQLIAQDLSAGLHQVVWNADGLPSGIYFAQLKTEFTVHNVKMSLIR